MLAVVKYEARKRNKAALTLLWDLNARNHEVTLLKVKHVRLGERYGEAEIPHESKTGSGPALLMCSFPYVRDWLNEHPFRNEPNAKHHLQPYDWKFHNSRHFSDRNEATQEEDNRSDSEWVYNRQPRKREPGTADKDQEMESLLH